MTPPKLIVYKGRNSQTGLAFKKEFPEITDFDNTEHEFDDIRVLMKDKSIKVVLPIWNSHFGEITSHALSMIFGEIARLYKLWPGKIIFECLSKNSDSSHDNKIISADVAKEQCSKFISIKGYEFYGVGSTTEAYTNFKNDKKFNTVLCAPGTNIDGYDIISEDASNPINFTTFALLASVDSDNWDTKEWEPFPRNVYQGDRIFTALQMPLSQPLSDTQEEFFHNLIIDAKHIDEIPKVLFVAGHANSNCRMILESSDEFEPSPILNEEGTYEDIYIIQDVGKTAEKYPNRIIDFLAHYPNLLSQDFIKHQGTKACFFACPPLGIVTHGLETYVTEFIVRQFIKKCFDLQILGADVSDEQKEFFDKYVDDFQEQGIDFITFKDVEISGHNT